MCALPPSEFHLVLTEWSSDFSSLFLCSFPVLLLGGAAALYTVSPISYLLTPREIAYVLAKARPQVLITTTGAEGEFKLRSALQILLDQTPESVGSVTPSEIQSWAKELAKSWDEGKSLSFQRGDSQDLKQQRIFTVDLAKDYYGSTADSDPRDWSKLLLPPKGHKHAGSSDHLGRLPFEVKEMTAEEQKRRICVLLWSSGTTGKSKGVLLPHLSFVANSIAVWSQAHWTQKDGGEVSVTRRKREVLHQSLISIFRFSSLALGWTSSLESYLWTR